MLYLKNTAVRVGKAAGTKAGSQRTVGCMVRSGWGGGACCQHPAGTKACPGNTEDSAVLFQGPM